PDLHPGTDEKMIVLKREMMHMIDMPMEEAIEMIALLWMLIPIFPISLAVSFESEDPLTPAEHEQLFSGTLEVIKILSEKYMKFSSQIEMIDSIVNSVCTKYPELHPGSEEDLLRLKREISYFILLKRKEQLEILAGFPSKYKLLPSIFKKAKRVGSLILPANENENYIKRESENIFLLEYFLARPLREHGEMKKEYYAGLGWSKEEIKEDRMNTELKLIEIIHSDDPNVILESFSVKVRQKYEL
ncbi:hypothetical protein PMAYCL1PPCAC_06074, partial [Pristionchus mayeri]